MKILIHGGAGTILRENITEEKQKIYKTVMELALQTGWLAMKNGGSALDAVEKAVKILEDSGLFNAGRGACHTSDGKIELDAAIMSGKTLEAGAVTGLKTVKNPISLARNVFEKSRYCFLSGNGAEEFARLHNAAFVDEAYFSQAEGWKEWQTRNEGKYGTVGAVALDADGNVAAATSTGGIPNKEFGRIGDSPIIGAGTYANNQTCAASATGQGEFFMRSVAAYHVSALMEYAGKTLEFAAKNAIEKVGAIGGLGGIIAIDCRGNISMPYNTLGMYRGWTDGTTIECAIFEELL